MSAGHEMRDLVRRLLRGGWKVERTGGGHLRLTSPAGLVAICASTPSEYRGLRNLRSRLRRMGFHWKEKRRHVQRKEDADDPG